MTVKLNLYDWMILVLLKHVQYLSFHTVRISDRKFLFTCRAVPLNDLGYWSAPTEIALFFFSSKMRRGDKFTDTQFLSSPIFRSKKKKQPVKKERGEAPVADGHWCDLGILYDILECILFSCEWTV